MATRGIVMYTDRFDHGLVAANDRNPRPGHTRRGTETRHRKHSSAPTHDTALFCTLHSALLGPANCTARTGRLPGRWQLLHSSSQRRISAPYGPYHRTITCTITCTILPSLESPQRLSCLVREISYAKNSV